MISLINDKIWRHWGFSFLTEEDQKKKIYSAFIERVKRYEIFIRLVEYILNGKEKVILLKLMDHWPMWSEKSKPNKGKMLSQQTYYILKGFKKANEVECEEAWCFHVNFMIVWSFFMTIAVLFVELYGTAGLFSSNYFLIELGRGVAGGGGSSWKIPSIILGFLRIFCR